MNVRVVPSIPETAIGPEIDAALIEALRKEFGDEVATSWFGRLQVEKIQGACAVVSVPTSFLRSWIRGHYTERLLAAARTIAPDIGKIDVVIRGTTSRSHVGTTPAATPALKLVASPPAPPFAAPSPKPPELRPASLGSPLDSRLTFASLHEGRSNLLAYAAGRQIVDAEPGSIPLYNPLFVHGDVGLGKTHLLQAIANEARGRRVIYLTAEKFMYGFAVALRQQASQSFRDLLREIDVLVVDDVQFLQGKVVEREFCNTVNAMLDARKQIVVAADRRPADLEGLEERTRSRLCGGLAIEIGGLDENLRVKMLESRVAAARVLMPRFDLSSSVIAYVASVIQTNGRDLDGAVNRLMAHASATQAEITVEMAEIAIRDLVRTREPKRVRIEDIQKLVATHYNVSRHDILSSRRTANVTRPRQIAMYLAKTMTLRSLPEIGRRFGGRDHTTVLHAVRKIADLAGSDRALGDEVRSLRRMLEEG